MIMNISVIGAGTIGSAIVKSLRQGMPDVKIFATRRNVDKLKE
jgi:3-hydroxyacyl-CoA dehydrogenase